MTQRKRTTLEGRVRHSQVGVYPFHKIVRAELERLARQVRNLKVPINTAADMIVSDTVDSVLALIRQAKK